MPAITRYLGMDPALAQDQFPQRAAEEVGRAKPIVAMQDVRRIRRMLFLNRSTSIESNTLALRIYNILVVVFRDYVAGEGRV